MTLRIGYCHSVNVNSKQRLNGLINIQTIGDTKKQSNKWKQKQKPLWKKGRQLYQGIYEALRSPLVVCCSLWSGVDGIWSAGFSLRSGFESVSSAGPSVKSAGLALRCVWDIASFLGRRQKYRGIQDLEQATCSSLSPFWLHLGQSLHTDSEVRHTELYNMQLCWSKISFDFVGYTFHPKRVSDIRYSTIEQ